MTHALSPVIAMIAIALLGVGCHKPEAETQAPAKAAEPAAAPIVVETAAVELRDMPRVITLLGNVVANQQSEVAANVAGRVLHTPIERGQAVKAGETILMVDSKAASLSASAASAQAELANTQLLQAREDCARAERLYAQGAMGKAEYDRQHTQCKAQELQATAAQAQAGLSLKLAADAVVRAPFSGVIGERYVNVGEYVQPSSRIASIYNLDPIRVIISVPERGVANVRTGVPLNIQVAAYPGRDFPATVEHVSPALRTMQRDMLVEATAPNPDGALRPGMFAEIQVTMGTENVPTVPASAVVAHGDVRRLFLARDGHAFEMVVRTGLTRDQRTVIYEQLGPDALVIVNPPADLADGAALSLGGSKHADATPANTPAQ